MWNDVLDRMPGNDQLEIPLRVVEAALKIAHESNVTTILDPAPAKALDSSLLQNVRIIKPNAGEAAVLTGVRAQNRSSARRAARSLLRKGAGCAIVQAGEEGTLLVTAGSEHWLPRIPVRSVDATGAGDAFVGTLAAQLARGGDLVAASNLANAASALATTKLGAQPGLPTLEEAQELLKERKAA